MINVKNHDNRCFIWAILSSLYPASSHSDRLSNYLPYEHSLDITGLEFPMAPNKINIFERNNPSIAVHCLAYESETKSFSVLYHSPEIHKRQHTITLLLLDSPSTNDVEKKRHYVYVKNLSSLIADRDNHGHKHHVCLSCLQVFNTERVLNEHARYCLVHKPQLTVFPDPNDPEKCKLSFRSHHYEFPFSFYLVADLESFLTPASPGEQSTNNEQIIDRHKISGFCVHRVSACEQFQTAPYTYSGPDAIDKFYEHIFKETRIISDILARDVPMKPLTLHQQAMYDSATECQNCKSSFTADNRKTRHHCHVTGNFLFSACNECNLALKPRRCRVSGKQDGDYLVPIVMHNLGGYDGHFLLKNFQKKYTQYQTKDGKVAYADVQVIPLTSEKNLQIRIGNIVFVDSFQFLATSLDTLVKIMRKSGTDGFVHTSNHFGQSEIFYQKGSFPYEYFSDESKFDETSLPPKEAFYSHLNEEALSDVDYERAVKVWNHFDMKTLREYHDFYLTLDVLLLSDVFERFRHAMLKAHGLDCLHFPSLPSMTLQMALKITDVELDLITDPSIYLMIESGIRGGLSYVAKRHARANVPDSPEYRPDEPPSYLAYWDCNSLYATCQTYSLPVGDFRFLTDEEIRTFDVHSVPADSSTGFILEINLRYPESLHDLHNAYPLAPDHLKIEEDMLSPTLRDILSATDMRHTTSTKLVSDLRDKTHYVTHYRCLQFYLAHGLELTKIHRIISFTQRPFMLPFVQYCNEQRRNAESDFESGLYKLFANSFYGKSVENVRKRTNVRLITDPQKLVRAAGKATFKRSEIINSDLVLVEMARSKVVLNKPIAIGFTILEFAKLVMFRFYYDCLLPKFGDKL